MERKIGEIFEYNGEWYQCVKSDGTCNGCIGKFQPYSFCNDFKECVGKIFKKLEKVGEPMKIHGRLVIKVKADAYKCMRCCFYSKGKCELTIQECEHYDCGEESNFLEVKENKEDMEEGKLDPHMEKVIDEATQKLGNEISKQLKENLNKQRMKPFNLEDAKAGRPVCTRDGRKARIICFDAKFPKTGNIVTLVEKENGEEVTLYHYDDGHCSIGRAYALMMLPEKKEGWVNVYNDSLIYDTKEEALNRRSEFRGYIDTVKVSWEE